MYNEKLYYIKHPIDYITDGGVKFRKQLILLEITDYNPIQFRN